MKSKYKKYWVVCEWAAIYVTAPSGKHALKEFLKDLNVFNSKDSMKDFKLLKRDENSRQGTDKYIFKETEYSVQIRYERKQTI